MKYFIILLVLIGFAGTVFASELQLVQTIQPEVELLPDDMIKYGASFTIHVWLSSYENRPENLGFYVDVLDSKLNQIDSTLWFAKQDFVYEFDTTHPAYNITQSGNYFVRIEKADYMERTGSFPKTIEFEITFPPQTQIEIISWDDFGYEFVGDAAIFKNNLAGLGIIEAGTQYYIVQKAEFTASSFGNKDTRVNATIGYAIQKGDKMLRPPMNENATDADHDEFMKKMNKQKEEFPLQSTIGDSYDFVVDVENPFYIKFPFVIEESGQYTRQFYKNTRIFEGPASSGMGGLVVVEKFSKAVDENSQCKNNDLRRLIKYDYSTVACVNFSSALKLIERGWGI